QIPLGTPTRNQGTCITAGAFFMSVPRYKNKTLWKSKQKRRPGKSRDASFCINSLYFLPLHQAASFHRK
ncbi:hypothetical protein, partial [Desulfovibrio piger]|uniref:hypothetical protein n=1 Tax=Desulfovibrio piger TaxID=901 RepID=UPI0024315B2F